MKLTECQENAKFEIENFLTDTHRDMLILSAPAGCGKSFLVQEILSNLSNINSLRHTLDNQLLQNIHLSAMSNKAAQVIGGVTFDKLFSLYPKVNYDTGQTYRQRKNGFKHVFNDSVIVIDEAGTMDTDALQHLKGGINQSKVILPLDRYQLPPVGMDEAPLFDGSIDMVEMVTPVRQNEGPLLDLCQSLREGVKDQVIKLLPASDQVVYIDDTGAEQFFRTMTSNDKVLVYTNELAIRLNDVVRGYKGISGFWKQGETVVVNHVHKYNGQVVLTNEETLQICEVNSTPVTNEFGIDCYSVATNKGHYLVPINPSDLTSALKSAKRKKNWKLFYAIKDGVPDFRGNWTSTVHKSQGSTYDRVFINLNNLSTARYQSLNIFLRLLYVAISRAKYKVYLYGSI